jgi:hypothetical protein
MRGFGHQVAEQGDVDERIPLSKVEAEALDGEAATAGETTKALNAAAVDLTQEEPVSLAAETGFRRVRGAGRMRTEAGLEGAHD